jgi:hypothetical protein
MSFRISTILAVVVIVVSGILSATSATYLIEGALTYEGHGLGEPEGYNAKIFTEAFQVSVDDCKWTIKITLVGNTNYSYSLSTFDGTNVIYLDRLNQEAYDLLRKNLRHGVTNLYQSCIVESTPVPRTMGSIANAYPWLAFASGCYFKTVTNDTAWDIVPLNIQMSYFAGRRQVPCSFTLSELPPYLPKRLEYKWTNINKMSVDGKILSFDLPPVFGGNFVAAEFRSDDYTNVSGLSFPTKFGMREYRPMPNATNVNDFRCTLIVKGAVTSISTTPQPWSNELPNETLSVNDYRFYTNTPVARYLTSNGIILSSADPRLAPAKHAALQLFSPVNKIAQNQSRGIRANRIFVQILLGVTIVAPILLLLRKYKAIKNTNKQKG